jgi:hypothetical protein
VYSKLHSCTHLLIALVLSSVGVLAAQAQAPAAPPTPPAATTVAAAQATPVTTASFRGHIADPTGAVIPGATITIATPAGATVGTVTADDTGHYAVNGLAPGSYLVRASVAGFAPFASQVIQLAAGQVKRVDIAMAMEVAEQSVVVTDESPSVNVEAGGNANAIVLKGKDLDALSDDPDELSNELTALAGPAAGPNGGQIYIDGFSGGQLPPKSAIREIRINQNPFSAEFDRLGYGRIEILTKPGTDKLHGQFFLQGNDNVFNTGDPFIKTIPSYYSYQFNGTVSGAISKSASFFASAEQRNTENVNAWLIPDAVIENASNVYVDNTNYGVNLLNRRIRDNASVRIDWQLGTKDTFTARYGFWSESEHNDLNSGSLASASTHESNTDHTVQMSNAIVINDHTVNETRFQFERQNENHFPDSTARTINVTGDFTGGGYPGQQYRDHATRLEFWNITTLSHGAHAIKFGTRMRDSRDANMTNSNFNGMFAFASFDKYLSMANALADSTSNTTFADQVALGNGPSSASYTSGPESALANVFDIALFAQDDWKVNPRLTLSGGLRWEAQNHISDHNDWAPRVSLAYALDGDGGKKTKTVLRAGYGLFYDRLDVRNLLTVNRTNAQDQTVFNFPTCGSATTSGPAISLDQIELTSANCQSTGSSSSNASARALYEVDPHYHSPYTGQAGTSIERQLVPGTSLTLTYLRSFGVHQMVTRNANQAIGGTPRDASGDYLYEYFPEAVFKENQAIASVNSKVNKNLSLTGFYTLAWANSNSVGGTGANTSDAYDLDNDYGRATFISRNSLFVMGGYNGPWGIRFNPFVVAQSGRPFNITLPTDPLNNFGNQRPAYAATADCTAGSTRYYQTDYGCLDSTPTSSETTVPVNLGNGPAAVAVNLRISRGFGIGPKTESTTNQGAGGGPDGGGGGGRRGGPPGGSLGPGGLGGGGRGGPGGMFGPTATGHKYSLNFSVQALNLFNDIDYGTPTGNLTSPNFNRSTNLAGGIFSSGSAARRIFAQAVFSF